MRITQICEGGGRTRTTIAINSNAFRKTLQEMTKLAKTVSQVRLNTLFLQMHMKSKKTADDIFGIVYVSSFKGAL